MVSEEGRSSFYVAEKRSISASKAESTQPHLCRLPCMIVVLETIVRERKASR